MLAGDFNADGIPDFATLDYQGGSFSVRMGVGDGSFSEAPTIHLDNWVRFSHAADLNLDGCTDLLHTSAYPALSVHLSNCDGTFAPRQDHLIRGDEQGLTVADFDLDGLRDVALTPMHVR